MNTAMFDSLIERRAYLVSRMEALVRTFDREDCPQYGEAHDAWKALAAELDRIDAVLTRAHHPEAPSCQCDD